MISLFKTLEKKIADWDDDEVLFNFGHFLERVGIGTRFVQDDDGNITHQILVCTCGDKYFSSSPQELLNPLQFVPATDEEKKKAN